MNETVYVLLPVHNRREITRRFIDCLLAQRYDKYHLVLIDDGSTDGTAEMVLDLLPKATVLSGKGTWWWAGSLQQGVDWLQRQQISPDSIILIINDDTVIEHDFLASAASFLAEREKTLLLSRYYSLQDGRLIDAGLHIDWQRFTCLPVETPERINCLSTRGLFFRFSDLREIGGFYPRLLPHYYSDYEFTIRAHRKGFRLVTDAAVVLRGDEISTGTHSIGGLSTLATLKKLFSVRTIPNPAVMTLYILLACPLRWIPINLARMWLGTVLLVRDALVRDIRDRVSLRLS